VKVKDGGDATNRGGNNHFVSFALSRGGETRRVNLRTEEEDMNRAGARVCSF
jgi:hypothetical protein